MPYQPEKSNRSCERHTPIFEPKLAKNTPYLVMQYFQNYNHTYFVLLLLTISQKNFQNIHRRDSGNQRFELRHFFQKSLHTTSSHLWWPPGRHISIICKKSTSHFLFVKVSLFGDSIFTGQQWKNIRALITELIQCRICLSLCQLFFSNFYFCTTY